MSIWNPITRHRWSSPGRQGDGPHQHRRRSPFRIRSRPGSSSWRAHAALPRSGSLTRRTAAPARSPRGRAPAVAACRASGHSPQPPGGGCTRPSIGLARRARPGSAPEPAGAAAVATRTAGGSQVKYTWNLPRGQGRGIGSARQRGTSPPPATLVDGGVGATIAARHLRGRRSWHRPVCR